MNGKTIKQNVRAIISELPGGKTLLRWRESLRMRLYFLNSDHAKSVFRDRYQHNEWDSPESVSGPGSTLVYTANIRTQIPRLFEELKIHSILDAPCGDFNWLKLIEWKTPISYLGGDIVEDLVRINQTCYEKDTTQFVHLDIVRDHLPKADLWLCRDCFFHLSEREIFLAIDHFLKSDITYLLTSTHPDCNLNRDIPTGAFRLLNLELPPFNFGPPERRMDDWIEGFPVRQLALWNRVALGEALISNTAFQRTVRRHR